VALGGFGLDAAETIVTRGRAKMECIEVMLCSYCM